MLDGSLHFLHVLFTPQGDYKAMGQIDERNDRQVDPPSLNNYYFQIFAVQHPLYFNSKSRKFTLSYLIRDIVAVFKHF